MSSANSALAFLARSLRKQVDSAPHNLREDALSFFVVGLDPENVAGKRLGHSDDTMEATAASANTFEVLRSINLAEQAQALDPVERRWELGGQ